MSARKNQSKFQITYLLLIKTQILFDFHALRWWKKKLLNLALLYYKHSFLPVKKSCQSIRINKFLQLTLSKTIQVTAKALDFWPKRMIWRVISQSLYSCHTSTGGCKNVYDFLFLFPRETNGNQVFAWESHIKYMYFSELKYICLTLENLGIWGIPHTIHLDECFEFYFFKHLALHILKNKLFWLSRLWWMNFKSLSDRIKLIQTIVLIR